MIICQSKSPSSSDKAIINAYSKTFENNGIYIITCVLKLYELIVIRTIVILN